MSANKTHTKPSKKSLAQEILDKGDIPSVRALFAFDSENTEEEIWVKFQLWARWFFYKFFKSKDAPFHKEMDVRRIRLYTGKDTSFLNIAFRDSAKTTRAKLFRAFVIANDTEHTRKYMRVLSKDLGNSKQSVTDIYNLLISPRVKYYYPEIFVKSETKREETMSSFTTSTGVKMIADTVGTDQRGALQEESRPDFDWYDDFETKLSLMSAVTTNKIWQNMEEARTGLAKNGASEYTCNYISEMGNVHKLVEKIENQMIVPIEENGVPTWDRFTKEDIQRIKKETEDYEGEYLCKPSAAKDIYFDRERLEKMPLLEPIQEFSGFKIYKKYNPSHAYGGGADVAGGVGLDSSATVFIDFSTFPAQVAGTFHDNMIQPEAFGDECYSEGNRFGTCILAIENNKFDQAILKAKLLGANLYKTKTGTTLKLATGSQVQYNYGWNTNSLTKTQMFSALRSAIEDGLIELNDPELIKEAKGYTRNDLIDREPDARLVTRHFDLLTACAIAWQMKNEAKAKSPNKEEDWDDVPEVKKFNRGA